MSLSVTAMLCSDSPATGKAERVGVGQDLVGPGVCTSLDHAGPGNF